MVSARRHHLAITRNVLAGTTGSRLTPPGPTSRLAVSFALPKSSAGAACPLTSATACWSFLHAITCLNKHAEEVLARIEAGEKLGRAQAQEMVGGKRSAPKAARPVIIGWIEMESWRLQTITETQSNTIASERQEIAQIASASLLLSYRENPDSLAEIKAATDANSK
jgi:hypothetical protein